MKTPENGDPRWNLGLYKRKEKNGCRISATVKEKRTFQKAVRICKKRLKGIRKKKERCKQSKGRKKEKIVKN